jgi:hypothetical protein
VITFFKDHGSNPVDDLGLPATIGSAVVEIICAIQKYLPNAFGNRAINWRRYLHRAHHEIDELEIDERAKGEERRFFTTKRCIVPRQAYLRYRAEQFAKKALQFMRLLPLARTVAKTVIPTRPAIAIAVSHEDATREPRRREPWEEALQCVTQRACSIEEAIDLAIENNPPL